MPTCPHYDIENAITEMVSIGNVRKLNDGIEGGMLCKLCGAKFSWYHIALALQHFGTRPPSCPPKGRR